MDIVGYAKDMLELGTLPAFLSLGIIAIFSFLIIWHSIRGYQRGVFKQVFHLGFVIISIVVSYYVTAFLWSKSLSILDGYTIESLVGLFGVTLPENLSNTFGAFDMQVIEYIMLLPVGVVAMPFVFTSVFFMLNLVFKLFYVITVGLLHIPFAQSKVSEIPGLMLGLVEGLLVAFMILLPFADVSSISTEAYDMMVESREERGLDETDGEKFLATYAVPISENPVLKLVNLVGGDKLLDSFASFEDGYGTMNMREEFASTIKLSFLDFASLHDADWMQLAPHHKLAIDSIVDSIEDSRYKTVILSELLSCMGHLVGTVNDAALGTEAKSSIIVSLFSIFEDLNPDELNDVLTVFKEFYYYMSDEGILKAYENGDNSALVLLFTKKNADGKSNLAAITDIFNKNERTMVLSSEMTKLSMSVLAGGAGMDANAQQKYNNVKGSVNSTLAGLDTTKPKEEQVSDMSAALMSSLTENGMPIEPAVADDMAQYIVEKHGGKDSLTDAEFDDALLYYYEAKKNHDDSLKQDANEPEDPGTEDPGTEDPGTEDPGTEDPGTEDPGTEDPGTEDPGTEDPGTDIAV